MSRSRSGGVEADPTPCILRTSAYPIPTTEGAAAETTRGHPARGAVGWRATRSGILQKSRTPQQMTRSKVRSSTSDSNSRVHLLVEPRTCESEHRPGRVHAAEARDARGERSAAACGAAADVEHGIGDRGSASSMTAFRWLASTGSRRPCGPRGEYFRPYGRRSRRRALRFPSRPAFVR